MGWCPAAAAALTPLIVVCLCPSWAFLHVSSTSPRAATPATTGTAGASSSFGYGRRAIPTSRETFRRRASRRKEDLKRKSLSGEGGEADALLLRMDFEHGEVDEIRDWIRRFPFGTALPVQPFSLVETETGVNVEFRKKPTLERGGRDGGLCFTVEDTEAEDGVDIPPGPTLIMRRNAEGQEIRKMFAERIVVKAVVKSLAGGGAPPGVKVRTVLHEGLV